jgi:hypothetical protein
METGLAAFVKELRALGYEPEDRGENKVAIGYSVPCGRFEGQQIRLGFQIPPDFSLNPPGGPHVCPRLLPINSAASTHPQRVAESPFGKEWEYWSRPFTDWAKTNRTVKEYLGFIRHLFVTQ